MSARDSSGKTEGPDDFTGLETYANNVTMRFGAYDVCLRFGIETGGAIRETAVVFMSPQHARSLSMLLQRYVQHVEKNAGPISLPEEVLKKLEGAQPEGQAEREEPS